MEIIFIIIVILLITATFIYLYLFQIYEIEVSVTPKELFADNKSTVMIQAYPINSFGKRIAFRSVAARFEIIEGKELILIEKMDAGNGLMVLKGKDKTGTVKVLVTPEKSLMPSLIQIQVNPNYAVNKI